MSSTWQPACHVPVFFSPENLRGYISELTYQKESFFYWCWIINELQPADNLSSPLRLAVRQRMETGGNPLCIPTSLLIIDIYRDASLSFHHNCRPSVPSNKIFDLLMDSQQSDAQSQADTATCLVLAKAAQKNDRKSIWSQGGREKHMPGPVLMA